MVTRSTGNLLTLAAGAPTRGRGGAIDVPRPRFRWSTRVLLPLAMLLGAVGVLGYSARESLRPAVEVTVLPVIARPPALIEASPEARSASTPAARVILAQAPGWVEPEPYAVLVQPLIEGVVREVHVLEGERVEAGQVVVTLIDEDARLALERADAEVLTERASVERMKADLPIALARVAELRDEVERKRGLVEIRGISEGEFTRLTLRLKAAEAEADAARAAVAVAEAALKRAEVERRTAQLALERTVIRAPVSGVVLSRTVQPGTRISMAISGGGGGGGAGGGGAGMSAMLSLYDPARLQVRADVPLADFGKIALGTRAEVTTEALPDVVLTGEVRRIVHEADIQRNTVAVKVVLDAPPSVLKPDMLMRVRFVSGGEATSAGAGAPRDGEAVAELRLYVPEAALTERASDRAVVWLARPTRGGRAVAERRDVTLQSAADAGYVRVLDGVKAGDRVIVQSSGPLAPGGIVRVRDDSIAVHAMEGAVDHALH
ncbi:MAG: efflux RND transporter periplasmic adaptor subunit [Phycisphaeraceae bacterium]|nr:MAG: efflux RND transporter periplasmic adaptor subunit [Phycisphaeraceae bacterium]